MFFIIYTFRKSYNILPVNIPPPILYTGTSKNQTILYIHHHHLHTISTINTINEKTLKQKSFSKILFEKLTHRPDR